VSGLRVDTAALRADGDAQVLVVEDDEPLRVLFARILGRHGYRVGVACDGERALELSRQRPPDLILLDLGLPGEVDGMRLLQELRSIERLAATPLIVVSGRDDLQTVVAALVGGALDYLTKPVDATELVARCIAALRTKRAIDALQTAMRRLEREALTDPLTGLGNRRSGLDALTRADATARRHGRAPALLYVDLDSLKLINDLHGHAAGDAAIRQLARRLSASMRGVDVVARVGGDEFIVVLDDSAPENVARVAARIQAAIAAEPVEAMGSTLPVTASIGCAAWRGGDTVEQWLGRADQALYEAKRSGRGRVHLASG